MLCHIDIFLSGAWRTAAQFESAFENKGYRGAGQFFYEVDYVADYIENAHAALSCRYPVGFDLLQTTTWPAFLLDILPTGAGRRTLLQDLKLTDGTSADWPLLLSGAGNPPGNLRIREAAITPTKHEGFTYTEVVERREDFIEYAKTHGAPVSGSSGAHGDAPKFLLAVDEQGRWHADGALDDALVRQHWLVKFPRGKAESDRTILRNEAAYYRVAEKVGLRVGRALNFDNNALFIPRFDRLVKPDEKVERLGLESLCSLANIAEFGAWTSHDELIRSVAQYSTDRQADIEEYILRDVLNVALGNTDNHARNTAMLKSGNKIRLSPLFDFAPMFLDDAGIARSSRWKDAESLGRPQWGKVAESVSQYGIDAKALRLRLHQFANTTEALPEIMRFCGVDDELIERLLPRIIGITEQLQDARPTVTSASNKRPRP